jgi:hypothetical protein
VVDVKPTPTITGNLNVCLGSSTQLTGSGTPAVSNPWISGNGAVASVSNTGLVTGLSLGTSVITYTDITGCSKTATVSVNEVPSAVSVTPATKTLCPNEIQSLTASGGYIYGGTGTAGTGTTSSVTYGPYKGANGGNKVQYLVDASELTAMGMSAGKRISEIKFAITAFTGPYTFNNFTIGMKNTAIAALTTTWETGLTTVLPPANFTLSGTAPFVQSHTITPFTWDGSSNLLIEFCFNNNNAGTAGASASIAYLAKTGNHCHYYSANSIADLCSNPAAGSVTTIRPNVTLSYLSPAAMTWAPQTELYINSGATTAYTGGPAYTVWTKPTANITYTVTATTAGGCTNTGTSDISVYTASVAPSSISGITTVCLNDSTTLTANGGVEGTIATTNWYKGSCTNAFVEDGFT